MHTVDLNNLDRVLPLAEAEREAIPYIQGSADHRNSRTERIQAWTERLAPWGLAFKADWIPNIVGSSLEGLGQGRSWRGAARKEFISRTPFPGGSFDHPLAWRIGRYPALVVGEPYTLSHVRELLETAKEIEGLVCRVGGDSLYLPGRTYVVELWNAAVFGTQRVSAA